jgi:hypothetical protein
LSTGDFDRDTKQDVAVSFQSISGSDPQAIVAVLYGNGDGTLQTPLVKPVTGVDPIGLVTRDFDRDGLPDLAVVDSAAVTVLRHDPVHTASFPLFSTAGELPNGILKPRAIAAFDLLSGDVPLPLLATGVGAFVSTAAPAPPGNLLVNGIGQVFDIANGGPIDIHLPGIKAIVAAKLQAGAFPDLGLINDDNQLFIGPVVQNDAQGKAVSTNQLVAYHVGPSPTALVVADLNGDGQPDVLVAEGGSDPVQVLLGQSAAPVTVGLDPASDSGVSPTDGISNIAMPAFAGKARPAEPVILYAERNGQASPVAVGTAVADTGGHFRVQPTAALGDGSYAMFVGPGDSAAVTPPMSPVAVGAGGSNRLIVDTEGPRITGSQFNAKAHHLIVTFSDDASGLATSSLSNPASYSIGLIARNGKVTPLPVASAVLGPDGRTVTITYNAGRKRPNAKATFRVTVAAAGITDIAGNRLDGAFNGTTFPTGTSHESSDFIETFGPAPLVRKGRHHLIRLNRSSNSTR